MQISSREISIDVSVRPANVTAGLLRTHLQFEASTETDPTRWFARYYLFSACIACSSGTITIGDISSPITGLSFDDYLNLSDELTIPWLNLVYETNPHWVPPTEISEEEKKKA